MTALLRNYVGGKWVETGRTFLNINPVDGTKVCDVSEADQETVGRAACRHSPSAEESSMNRSLVL